MKRKLMSIISALTLFYVIFDYSAMSGAVSALSKSESTYFIGGETVGIKLYSDGVICVDFEEGENPSVEAGIKKGDIILAISGKRIKNTDEFARLIDESKGEIEILYERKGKEYNTSLTPKCDESGKKMVGMWVRDSIGGVGTVTFYDDTNKMMATLGHSVADSDTGTSFKVQKGYITDCKIVDIKKSTPGCPGEIEGAFKKNEKIYGYITKNTENGLFANSSGLMMSKKESIQLASSAEIKDGYALLYSAIAGGEVIPYAVSIKKVALSKKGDMIIEIKDERLLELTGGIVQGMSGSPIVQNGKLIGAVTHVFVAEPQKGYGIFIENMIK